MVTQTEIPTPTVSNPWWGHDPSDKQLEALWVYEDCPDLFYGGAAGPGKTSYLLMAAVQYVQYPHYRALILRKTYADLSLPDAIMDRAISWWDGVEGARFNNQEQDVDVVSEPVQQRSGEPFRAEALGQLVEGEVGGYHDGAPLVALGEDLEEQLGRGAEQGHEAYLVDDHLKVSLPA